MSNLFPFSKAILPVMGLWMLFLGSCKEEFKKNCQGEDCTRLILNIELGMPQKAYFDSCHENNKRKLVMDGEDLRVIYDLKDLSHPGRLGFKPKFDTSSKLAAWEARFNYYAWAPWNQHLFADSLMLDVQKWVDKRFGHGTWVQKNSGTQTRLLRLEGTRNTEIKKIDEQHVLLTIWDPTRYNLSTE
jgi:hypothetical protein